MEYKKDYETREKFFEDMINKMEKQDQTKEDIILANPFIDNVLQHNKIEILDYYRLDIPKLPRHIRELNDEEIPNEIFFGKKWLFVENGTFLHKDCAELAHYFDEKYRDKFVYKYHQKEVSSNWNLDEENFNFLV